MQFLLLRKIDVFHLRDIRQKGKDWSFNIRNIFGIFKKFRNYKYMKIYLENNIFVCFSCYWLNFACACLYVNIYVCVFLYINNICNKPTLLVKISSLIKILVKCHKNEAPLTTLDYFSIT